jgi:acyl carrier protein
MQNTDLLRSLDELLEQAPGTLCPDSRLEAFGWSSLSVIEFIALADRDFGAAVSSNAVARCETVGDLAALLAGAGSLSVQPV